MKDFPIFNKAKALVRERWSAPDYPGGSPRFQVHSFVRDVAIFVLLPAGAVIFSKAIGEAADSPRKIKPRAQSNEPARFDGAKPQVLDFQRPRQASEVGPAKRAPGTLVRVRLLNVVESYGTAPVHVRIMDAGLGRSFIGGTLVGDGTGDTSFDRININFRVARLRWNESAAFSISARALSLNGTLGLDALKKEGAFARAAFGAGSTGAAAAQSNFDSGDLKSIFVRALTAGLAQEFGSGSQIERNRASLLTLKPGTEFFAELIDFFPTAGQ